jgi:hypothetical protein
MGERSMRERLYLYEDRYTGNFILSSKDSERKHPIRIRNQDLAHRIRELECKFVSSGVASLLINTKTTQD